ncbi:MAG: response regulator [Candidatus Coatesbacteria bacterium]
MIIVVDDNDMVRGFVSGLLRDEGFIVVEASGGIEALAACRPDAGPVQVLVTDIEMPGMNGRELAKQIVGARPEVRVLYMSGLSRAAVERDGPIESWAVFLGKPFSPPSLLSAVRELQAKVGAE